MIFCGYRYLYRSSYRTSIFTKFQSAKSDPDLWIRKAPVVPVPYLYLWENVGEYLSAAGVNGAGKPLLGQRLGLTLEPSPIHHLNIIILGVIKAQLAPRFCKLKTRSILDLKLVLKTQSESLMKFLKKF